jgi:hypothetical protein
MNRLSKINEHSDTSKSLDTKRSHYCENNPVGRRWTDEVDISPKKRDFSLFYFCYYYSLHMLNLVFD